MLKKAALFLGLALTLKANAFAWVGGPFSNGGFNNLIERNGVYHATFNFKNGSGYAYFTPENSATPATANTTSFDSPGSLRNRSVIYYKGMVFVGMASGTSDIDKRKISGITNGYSEYRNAAATNNSSSVTSSVSSTNTINTNAGGMSYTANTHFSAKIKQTHPQIRFRGKGELAVISPNAHVAVSEAILETLSDSFAQQMERMNASYQRVLDGIVSTHLPTEKIVTVVTQQWVEPTETIPGYYRNVAENVTVANDPFTAQQIQTAVDLMNLISENNIGQNQISMAASMQQLYDSLTPPSAQDIAEQYTEYVDMRVTGVLRSL